MHALRAGLRQAPPAALHRFAVTSTRSFSLAPIASFTASHAASEAADTPSAAPTLAGKLRHKRAQRGDTVEANPSLHPSTAADGSSTPASQADKAGAARAEADTAAEPRSRVSAFGVTAGLRIPVRGQVEREEAVERKKDGKRRNRRQKTARQKELALQRLAEKGRAEPRTPAHNDRPGYNESLALEKGIATAKRGEPQRPVVHRRPPSRAHVNAKLQLISRLKQALRRVQTLSKPWDELLPKQRSRQVEYFYRTQRDPTIGPSADSGPDTTELAAAFGLSNDAPAAPGSFDAVVKSTGPSNQEVVASLEVAAEKARIEKVCEEQWPKRLRQLHNRGKELKHKLDETRRELDDLRALPVPARGSLPKPEGPPLMEQIAETLVGQGSRPMAPEKRVPWAKGEGRGGGKREGEQRRGGRIRPFERRQSAPGGLGERTGPAEDGAGAFFLITSSVPPVDERSTAGYYSNHPALRSSPPPTDDGARARELSSYQHVLSPSSIPYHSRPSPVGDVPIATLAHSLDRVLFNPGVHFLRDPRTGVYNFARDVLENVPKVDEFDFTKLPQYVTSSRDEVLRGLMEGEGRTFAGSTSSTIGMLCQIYFWLSMGKPINTDMLSGNFCNVGAAGRDFSMGQRLPASVVLRHTDGRYSIDADKSFDAGIETNILASYGHLMEKLLTTEASEFKRFLHDSEDPAPSEADHRQAYHYGMTEHMVLRSQLDAQNPYLPGKTFDLKTRGTVAIRQDRLNYEESAGYIIDKLRGPWESFEREYYDLIRSAFLKYQFQARIGNMDGIFVAYHSTARFYGFQYIPISEMDEALFGNSATGDAVFHLALGTLETVLARAAACFRGESVNVTFAADTDENVLRVFVARQNDLEAAEQGAASSDGLGIPMTLLEVRGRSYLDGEPQTKPVTLSDTLKADEKSHPAARRTWQLAFDIESSSTASSAGEDPVAPEEVARLFARTRAHQRMFSSLFLPTGISPSEVREAQARAQEAGVELDESDLALRFPVAEGLEYTSPNRNVKLLRRRARDGEERRKIEDEMRRGERVIEVVSQVVEREELLE
ncbi:hypothetical protein JCM3770_004903 [Rhodotorula araucariae]